VFDLTKIDPWFLVQIEDIITRRGLDALAESSATSMPSACAT
jgi:hypothetical protein